jgi:hypothetical protein
MKKLVAKVSTQQRSGLNPKTLYIYETDSGMVSYSYTNSRGSSFAISNMQCGWRGPNLPDCVYDYKNPFHLLRNVVKAVNGGVQMVTDSKLYSKKFNF